MTEVIGPLEGRNNLSSRRKIEQSQCPASSQEKRYELNGKLIVPMKLLEP